MDKVDVSSCAAIKPASGYDGQTIYDLVRNPNYDPNTDTKAARENFPDEVKFIVNASADDIYNKIEAGNLDMATSSIPPAVSEEVLDRSEPRRVGSSRTRATALGTCT